MWVAPSLLKATRGTAQRTEAASGACTRAAPSQLLQLARSTAERTEGEGFASRRAARSQSLKLQAARSASYARPHSCSPTVRRRSNPQHDLSLSLREHEAIQRWWRTSHKSAHG
jgi:hypothetical protein